MSKPTDPFYHTDRFKIEWIDDPEGGIKSACGRFRITPLPVEYRYGRFGWGMRVSVHPYMLTDNDPKWACFTTFQRRSDAFLCAERRKNL